MSDNAGKARIGGVVMATLDDGTLTVADWLEAAGVWCEDVPCNGAVARLCEWREDFDIELSHDLDDNGKGYDTSDLAEDSFCNIFELSGLLALAGAE